MFSLPKLNYKYNALEPHIDAQTMKIHHTKHHQGYVDKLNAALKDYSNFQSKSIEELLKDFNNLPQKIQVAVRNNGGGHFNHTLFWQILTPKKTKPQGDLLNAINKSFKSLDNFKKEFSQAAATRFGSGWAWLCKKDKKLQICSTANQDNCLGNGHKPILALDVWEHAYYLKYQNRRPDYIDAFWNIVNWDKVGELFKQNS